MEHLGQLLQTIQCFYKNPKIKMSFVITKTHNPYCAMLVIYYQLKYAKDFMKYVDDAF